MNKVCTVGAQSKEMLISKVNCFIVFLKCQRRFSPLGPAKLPNEQLRVVRPCCVSDVSSRVGQASREGLLDPPSNQNAKSLKMQNLYFEIIVCCFVRVASKQQGLTHGGGACFLNNTKTQNDDYLKYFHRKVILNL